MSYFVRKHDIANLILVAGGILMFFFHMSALVWPGYNPWGPGWCWGYEGPVPRGIFLVVQAVGSIGAIFVIVLAYMWDKDHNRIFASVISFFVIFNIWSGVIHANTSFYGFGFGIPLVLSGLLVLFGGAAKYDRYTKILALGTHLLESDNQERFEETSPRSPLTYRGYLPPTSDQKAPSEKHNDKGGRALLELVATGEPPRMGKAMLKKEEESKLCINCGAELPANAEFCISCGASQKSD